MPKFPLSSALVVLAAGLLFSCKKTDLPANNLSPASPGAAPVSANYRDTAAAIAREVYLWNEQIPGSFNGNSFNDINSMMTSLRQYSTESGFAGPVDRWSFAVPRSEWDNVSSGTSTGDFGLSVFFRSSSDLRVKHVERESPAGRAGVRRGWRVLRINGSDNISTSNTDFVVQNVFQSSNTTFTFVRPDNSQVTLNLAAAPYREHPIIKDTVLQEGGRKIGYFALNAFMGDSLEVAVGIRNSFVRFAAAGINDLVVDLRYNGGGYVYMQEALANYIAPASANGGVMMKQQFNARMSAYNETTNFHKAGAVNLPRVFFIVSKSTASASELLINNLRPYMETILVGPSATHGKPVGFFPIPVQEWYVFPVSFKTVNRDGQGNYYNGISTQATVADGLDKDWGDPNEASLGAAIHYAVNGTFARAGRSSEVSAAQDPAVTSGNARLDRPVVRGTIDTRGLR
ncbi:MAG: hypothetical protein EOO15_16095 [Chitinophagaceae bacterium]|nr:MAG: hypothetical protein EOO15_16095 [Chitinophagaceae bacterium]